MSAASRPVRRSVVEILHRQVGLRAAGFGPVGERDAAEEAAGRAVLATCWRASFEFVACRAAVVARLKQ